MVSTRLNMWPSFIYEYRVGWILTLWHTYFILIFAVISLILLCLKYIGEAPNVQHRACSTVKDTPQTHIWGKKGGAPLWRSKQCSLMSITESQLDAPFSLARSKDHCSDFGSLSSKYYGMYFGFTIIIRLNCWFHARLFIADFWRQIAKLLCDKIS